MCLGLSILHIFIILWLFKEEGAGDTDIAEEFVLYLLNESIFTKSQTHFFIWNLDKQDSNLLFASGPLTFPVSVFGKKKLFFFQYFVKLKIRLMQICPFDYVHGDPQSLSFKNIYTFPSISFNAEKIWATSIPSYTCVPLNSIPMSSHIYAAFQTFHQLFCGSILPGSNLTQALYIFLGLFCPSTSVASPSPLLSLIRPPSLVSPNLDCNPSRYYVVLPQKHVKAM